MSGLRRPRGRLGLPGAVETAPSPCRLAVGAGLGANAGEPKKGREALADVVTAELGRPCICSGVKHFEL